MRSRYIRVPAGPWALLGLAAVAVGLAVLGDRVQLGVALYMAKHRMPGSQLAKLARKGQMLLMAQMLIAKENHLPAQQGRADGVNFRCAQWLLQLDAANQCTDVGGLRGDVDVRRGVLCGIQLLVQTLCGGVGQGACS